MKIGELAKRVGMAPSAIRYYEQVGLLSVPERIGGQRIYGPAAVPPLRLIQMAQAAGFTISEIRKLLQGVEAAPLSEGWFALATKKRADIDEQIAKLQQMKLLLEALLRCECHTVDECIKIALGDPRLFDATGLSDDNVQRAD